MYVVQLTKLVHILFLIHLFLCQPDALTTDRTVRIVFTGKRFLSQPEESDTGLA